MCWLVPRGLESLKSIACNRGLWEDLGNGYVTKSPKKKRTSAQVTPESGPDDEGKVRLRISALNAGPAARIHYAEDGPVTEKSPVLSDAYFETKALKLNLLVADPSGLYETGAPVVWPNQLVLRTEEIGSGPGRKIALYVAPRGTVRYTTNGSEPREGTPYSEPFAIDDGDVLVRAFAEVEEFKDISVKKDFRFPAIGKTGVQIDDVKPGIMISKTGRKLDSRNKVFDGLTRAAEKKVTFEGVQLTIGQGNQVIGVNIGEVAVEADSIETLLTQVLTKFTPETPVTMSFRKGHFSSGHDLKEFAGELGIELKTEDVEQG
jgi:hypothetical protein